MSLKRPMQRVPSQLAIRRLVVSVGNSGPTARPIGLTRQKLIFGCGSIPCVSGRAGASWVKREGDGRTPFGRFRVLWGHFRGDRIGRPASRFKMVRTHPDDGWCDDPASANYNRPIKLPHPARHERLFREDGLYDILLVLDYNFTNTARPAGSAIFFHIWHSPSVRTEGCVAASLQNMRKLLCRMSSDATIIIGP